MMKRIYYIALILLTVIFAACEEIITLDLDTAQEKYVIEANLTDRRGGAKVMLSKTTGFEAVGGFNGVSGANISISGDDIATTRLTETQKGIYTHPTLRGSANKNYNLNVAINGQTFVAKCTMPAFVPVDSVYSMEIKLFDEPRKYTYVRFTDPAGFGNYYRFMEYKNGIYNKSINVANDDLTDGKTINQALRAFGDDSKLKTGDTVKVDFMTIAKPIYLYWYSSRSGAQSGGNNAAPINPVTNISGGALGYFSAHTSQVNQYVVK